MTVIKTPLTPSVIKFPYKNIYFVWKSHTASDPPENWTSFMNSLFIEKLEIKN